MIILDLMERSEQGEFDLKGVKTKNTSNGFEISRNTANVSQYGQVTIWKSTDALIAEVFMEVKPKKIGLGTSTLLLILNKLQKFAIENQSPIIVELEPATGEGKLFLTKIFNPICRVQSLIYPSRDCYSVRIERDGSFEMLKVSFD